MLALPLPSAAKSYLSAVVLFVIAATVKVMIVDKPWEHGHIWNYIASNVIIIPIIWVAGYSFCLAEIQYKSRRG